MQVAARNIASGRRFQFDSPANSFSLFSLQQLLGDPIAIVSGSVDVTPHMSGTPRATAKLPVWMCEGTPVPRCKQQDSTNYCPERRGGGRLARSAEAEVASPAHNSTINCSVTILPMHDLFMEMF